MPREAKMSALAELQEWYFTQCDGDWEHRYGIKIANMDNPGWGISIDLEGTVLADVPFPEYRENYDDKLDWLICNRYGGGQWSGMGGPRQLEHIIRLFLDWAQAALLPEPAPPVA